MRSFPRTCDLIKPKNQISNSLGDKLKQALSQPKKKKQRVPEKSLVRKPHVD
jgi:hypothetical protein